MDIDHRTPDFSGKNLIFILLVTIILPIVLPMGLLVSQPNNIEQEAFLREARPINGQGWLIIQNNTLQPTISPLILQKPKATIIQEIEPRVLQRIKMTITAYSSTPCQTDDTPFITASNSWVRDGIVANNYFPFGTRIRIPEYFGDKIFVIEDRMHWRKSDYQVDVWFPAKQQAINFGITKAYVEILED